MTTHAKDYYEPRSAPTTEPIVLEYADATWIERYGELIAMSLGLLAFGFCLGMIAFALIVRP